MYTRILSRARGGAAVIALSVLPHAVLAANDTPAEKVAYQPPNEIKFGHDAGSAAQKLATSDRLIFTAPPRGKLAEEQQIYQPIADYLSKVLGKKVVYQFSDNWLSYSKNMTEGRFDLIFDGPAFNGYRLDKMNYTPLVKLPEPFVFVVISKANDARIKDVKTLAGRSVCAHPAPNLGTLTMLSRFDNPARQPYLVEIQGWENAYKGLMAGKCEATVVPLKNLNKWDRDRTLTKVLYQSPALPNQALSASPQVPPEMQAKIKEALLSAEGLRACAKLLDTYASKQFVSATRDEYAGLSSLIRGNLYYH
jgi:ABC-type phosphate/phosphonate transport system substrate-binding protein